MQEECRCHCNDQQPACRNTIEFKDGLPQSYIRLTSNSIRTGRYSPMNCLPLLLFLFAKRLGNLYLLFGMVLAGSFPQLAPYDTSIYLFPFVISFVVFAIKEVLIERKFVRQDQKINQLVTKVCREDITDMTWGELSVGDIIYLRQGDTAPADIVLLDSQQLKHRSAITYVTTQQISGCNRVLMKKSAYLTQLQYRGLQKNNWPHYRQILSGKLTYENPSKDDGHFRAYLKLVRDPKVEQLTVENLIPRGSVIKTSLWVFGMVVFAGQDTKIMQMREQCRDKHHPGFFSQLSHRLVVFNVLANTALSVLFVVVHIDSQDMSMTNKIAYYLLLFSVLSSSLCYPFLDVLALYTAYKVEASLKVQVNNPEALQELGCVDYAIMNKMGVISTGEYLINEIMTPSCMYKVHDSALERKVRNSKRTGYRTIQQDNTNFVSLALTQKPLQLVQVGSCTQSEKFEIDDGIGLAMQSIPGDMVGRNKHYDYQLEPLVLDRVKMMKNVLCKEKQAYDSVLAMALCHEAKFHYNYKKEEFKGISQDPVEQLLLGFCKTVGVSYECYTDLAKQSLINIVNDEGQKEQYEILGTEQFQFVRSRFSIVYRMGDRASIVCKGTPDSMLSIIRFREGQKSKIENKLAQYKLEGIQPIIYAKKSLSSHEVANYQSEYMSVKLALTTTQREIDQFTQKYECDLEFVCMVGVNDGLATCHKEFVTHLTRCGIKYGLMTSDAADSTINVGKKLVGHSFTQKIDYIHLDIGSKEEIKYQISQTLTLMKNKPNFSYVIVLNQRTADMVLHDHDAQQHFIYLLYKCKSFIGYELRPETIGRLATALKENSPSTTTIMALGYGYHSLELTSRVDVSVGFGEAPADINAEELSQVIMLLKRGPSSFTTSLRLANQMLYRLGVVRCVLTLYEALTYDYMNRIIGSDVVWLALNIFMTLGAMLKIFFSVKDEQNGGDYRPTGTYSINSILKKNVFSNYLRNSYLESTLHGIVIVLTTYFVLPRCTYGYGFLYNNLTENTLILIHLAFTPILRLLLFRQKFLSWHENIIAFVSNFLLYCLCITLTALLTGRSLLPQYYALLLSYDCAVLVANSLLFNIALSYIIKAVLTKHYLKSVEIGSEQHPTLCQSFQANEDKELIKLLFSSVENINPNILQIMNEANIEYNSIKFNRLLEFKHDPLNHKFDFERQNHNYEVEGRVCIILAVYMVTQVLCALQEGGWTATPGVIYYVCAFLVLLIVAGCARLFESLQPLVNKALGMWIVLLCTGIMAQHQVSPLRDYLCCLCLLTLFLSEIVELRLLLMLTLMLLLCVTSIVAIYSNNQEFISSFLVMLFAISIAVLNLEQFRSETIDKKSKFLSEETFRNEADHAEDILSLLVPRFVHRYIKDGEYNLQQAQNNVSILFCYVCNFDTIVKQEGRNVVHLMDELFRQYDQLCHNYAVQKIETVGMTYMAATGITAWEDEFDNSYTRKNSVERLLRMSIAMMEKSKGIMYGKNKDKRLSIKIGIHTGKVVIGVIGYHKPQFSLIGDTVNTTSRHCSTAKEGEIILSEEAVKKLKYKLNLFDKKKAEMKGLGIVDVFRWKTNEMELGKDEEKNKRFRKAVKAVIDQLKSENKIVYKTIKERLNPALAFEGRSCRAKRSQRMTSVHSIHDKILELGNDLIKEEEEKHAQESPESPIDFGMLNSFKIKKYGGKGRMLMALQMVVLLVNTFYEVWLLKVHAAHLALRITFAVLLCVSIFKYADAFRQMFWRIMLLVIQLLMILDINAEMFYIVKPTFERQFLIVVKLLLLSLASDLQLFNFKQLILLTVVGYVLPLGFAVGFSPSSLQNHDLISFVFYCCLLLLRKHRIQRLTRQMYKSLAIQDKQKTEQEALVSQLLPKHAFLKLRNQNLSNKIELTDEIEGATLLFADIKGFTSYSNKNTPEQVVNMLRRLFEEFDKTCLKFNVYKVYTIGDCYVVLGFTNPFQRDIAQEAKNVVNMGLAMVDIVHTVRQQIDFEELDMRIGIHTGTIIGGIIGTDIVRYDIYGRDVMIANKFEEYGKTGAVHISAATKAILDNNRSANFKIVPNGTVKVEKLNVEIPGYIVSRKKFE